MSDSEFLWIKYGFVESIKSFRLIKERKTTMTTDEVIQYYREQMINNCLVINPERIKLIDDACIMLRFMMRDAQDDEIKAFSQYLNFKIMFYNYSGFVKYKKGYELGIKTPIDVLPAERKEAYNNYDILKYSELVIDLEYDWLMRLDKEDQIYNNYNYCYKVSLKRLEAIWRKYTFENFELLETHLNAAEESLTIHYAKGFFEGMKCSSEK